MQSCWDNGCFNSGLRPQEVIVVWQLLCVRAKMIRLYTYQYVASPFTQVSLCTIMSLFGIFPGVYRNIQRIWVCVSAPLHDRNCVSVYQLLFSPLSTRFFHPVSSRVTREHRENLVKLAKQFSNKAKDSLRRVRSSAITQAKKAKEGHSEDTIRLVEKRVRTNTIALIDREAEAVCRTFMHKSYFPIIHF